MLAQMLAESARDTAQLLCPLHDVLVANIVVVILNEVLNFVFKFGNFPDSQRDLTLSLPWPHQGSIECFRGQVCRKKGYRM